MIDNYDNIPENSKENVEEIYNEIIRMIQSESTDTFLRQKNVLPEKLRNLIALGAALASQQSQSIATCVEDCLKTGATKANIMQVLQLVIVMVEIPAKAYTTIAENAIEAFEVDK